ncbi:adenine-specific methyltransferase EcoRI family protein [Helicobacter felis]|uniref:adenine-specific methyltransferase EcoRI family protein n=1 Tax=Helicobacter felis TaxID=214 RepID=UPI000CF05316|nr:adenine-specific methyltransferase EcoRI family protein [Helicobacter felis]
MREYLYIVQSSLEPSKCKMGITNDLKRRLKEYNSITGQSQENTYNYLFTCEVASMRQIEQDIKNTFAHLREVRTREIYFYNPSLLEMYLSYIKAHPLFLAQVSLKSPKKTPQIKPKNVASLKDQGMEWADLLNKAKRVKNDEFYTRYEDIEKEIAHYPLKVWQDKVVFCNCDDAIGENRDYSDSSAFALYFLKHFFRLKLKKLICTHYGSKQDLFNAGSRGYIFTKEGAHEMKHTPPNYTGGFEEKESLRILNEEADIVCTNPPFSRAIEYWSLLVKSKKKFLILSNIANCITTAYIPYFAKRKVRPGFNEVHWFLNPKRQLVRAAGAWYTNLPIKNRPNISRLKFLPLEQIPQKYKRFDDAGVLLVDYSHIPTDYDLPFAVSATPILNGVLECGYKVAEHSKYNPHIEGKEKFARILICRA